MFCFYYSEKVRFYLIAFYLLTNSRNLLFVYLLTYLLTSFIVNPTYKEKLLKVTNNFSKSAPRKFHKFCQKLSHIFVIPCYDLRTGKEA